MRIIVTGAHGFVGSHLVPALQRDHEVVALDRTYDVTRDLDLPHADIIINLASLNSTKDSIERPDDYFSTNVVGNFRLLEAARRMRAGYMYLSSQKASEPNPYGASKLSAEAWTRAYKRTYHIPTVINSVGNLYGPKGDRFWINQFIMKSLNDETIEVWGDGSASRDMLFIEDLIELLVDEINNLELYAGHDVIPCGGGKKNVISVNEVLKWLDYRKVDYKEELGTLDKERVTDNRLVSSINGWEPRTELWEGLERTYKCYL